MYLYVCVYIYIYTHIAALQAQRLRACEERAGAISEVRICKLSRCVFVVHFNVETISISLKP